MKARGGRIGLSLLMVPALGCEPPPEASTFCFLDSNEPSVSAADQVGGHALVIKTSEGLFVVDGEGRRAVSGSEGVDDFAWNRDGTGFFVTRDGAVGFLPLEGGGVQEIYAGWPQAGFLAVSPDGATLAVSANLTDDRGSGWEIWLLGSDGKNARPVAEGYDPSWAPDGSRLYFEQHDPIVHLATLDLATNRVTPFLSGSDRNFSVEISPRGTYAAFSRGSARRVMLYTFADSSLVATVDESDGDRRVYDRFVSFSPDERYMAFFRQVQSPSAMALQIIACNLATGRSRVVVEGDVLEAQFAPVDIEW